MDSPMMLKLKLQSPLELSMRWELTKASLCWYERNRTYLHIDDRNGLFGFGEVAGHTIDCFGHIVQD